MVTKDEMAYLEEIEIKRLKNATKLLPAWFIPRMMEDEWHFAFIMSNGDMVHFTHIDDVHLSADGIWLDVDLNNDPGIAEVIKGRHITAPTSRTTASINARHIMMAIETADT